MAMASDSAVHRAALKLKHINISDHGPATNGNSAPQHINVSDHEPASIDNSAPSTASIQDASRDSSPGGSSHTASTATSPTISSSSSDLNPLAASFQPSSIVVPPEPGLEPATVSASSSIEARKTADQGFGLFATKFIKRGKLVICEAPLLSIPENAVHLVWGPYCRLSNAQKATYDSLHVYHPPTNDLEQVSIALLLDPTDDSLDEDDINELIADQVRVMSIFSVNNYLIPPNGLGVYATGSRLNHSCVPNVHHSYNPTLKHMTVYAVRDIEPGEQLYTTYLGGAATYEDRTRRIEQLRFTYGFTCTCPACSEPTGISDAHRQLLAHITFGLQRYSEGAEPQSPFIPDSPNTALKQAEDVIALMMLEGLCTMELCKAYRAASTYALQLKEYNKAFEMAHAEERVERICLGNVRHDIVRLGVAAQCWIAQLHDAVQTERREAAARKTIADFEAVVCKSGIKDHVVRQLYQKHR